MNWSVKTNNGTLSLTANDVLETLIPQIISKERHDHETLSHSFTKYLEAHHTLSTISLTQLTTMAFELGYFYRIMKEKNEVVIEEDIDEKASDNHTKKSSSQVISS